MIFFSFFGLNRTRHRKIESSTYERIKIDIGMKQKPDQFWPISVYSVEADMSASKSINDIIYKYFQVLLNF